MNGDNCYIGHCIQVAVIIKVEWEFNRSGNLSRDGIKIGVGIQVRK